MAFCVYFVPLVFYNDGPAMQQMQKKEDKKKAKFFIIETGKLLFLTAYSTCQKMLTLWGQTIFFSRL